MPEPSKLPELGELESQVMTHLWERGEADVRQAWEAIGADRGLTSNTVQSTLKGLYLKGLATGEKVSHAYLYRPALSREAYVRRCLEELTGALGAEPEPMLLAFVDLAEAAGPAQLHLAGGTVSLAAIIGFITLFGIATRNGIMMVSHIRHLVHEEGVTDRVEAVVQGASERLVPILMTALAAGLGLLPLALAMGEPGSEIQAPMAIVILCGLVTSTILNRVVVPAAYLRFGAAWSKEGE